MPTTPEKTTSKYINEKFSFSLSITVSLILLALFFQDYLNTTTSFTFGQAELAAETSSIKTQIDEIKSRMDRTRGPGPI
jgi:hypothetical protein